MPNVDKGCVTHSFACDCREERMRKLEKVAEAASQWCDEYFGPGNDIIGPARKTRDALAALESPNA